MLSQLKTAADKAQLIDSFKNDSNVRSIRKGYVVWLHSRNDQQGFLSTTKSVLDVAASNNIVKRDQVNYEALKRSVFRVISEANKKINLTKQGSNLANKLLEDFCIPTIQTSAPSSHSDSVVTVSTKYGTVDFPNPSPFIGINSCDDDSPTHTSPKRVISPMYKECEPSPKKQLMTQKTDCTKCRHRRKTIQTLSKINQRKQREVDELYVSSNAARCLRQALGRKENAKLKGQLVQANCYIKKMQKEANKMSNSQKVKKIYSRVN